MGNTPTTAPTHEIGSTPESESTEDAPSDGGIYSKNGIEISKQIIDFGMGQTGVCPLNEPVLDQFTITNHNSTKLKFKFEPIPLESCKITFSPLQGSVSAKKKVPSSKKIVVKFILVKQEPVAFRVNLRILNTNETIMLSVRARPDVGVFGADPSTLEQTNDVGFIVPKILVQMKIFLEQKTAFEDEGIFRLAGDAVEMRFVKDQMNATKCFDHSITSDSNTVANLLKVWFRDLPVPILNALPPEVISGAVSPQQSLQAAQLLHEPQKTLFRWLIVMLADVAEKRDRNKMSPQNLAIVVAPNLYDPPGSDPMEGLVMSQKSVQFLMHCLLDEIDQRKIRAEQGFVEDVGQDVGQEVGQEVGQTEEQGEWKQEEGGQMEEENYVS
eukprot:TRINITY_DN7477_c0_g1_i1.p1 TRINITY_DN7477_c0_g1~~TRINITY_DN7477_c0_g1_i1.p1  ORF type:complete len:384 (+),score=96.84 TRINITY_DN7477_c0_g1_i1:166-1317(+)